MREFTFTDADIAALRHERFHHPHPRVQEKMEVLWLKSRGLPHAEIARLTDLSRRTVQRYLDEYLDGGVAALRRVNFHRPQSDLAARAQSLEDYFLENPPRSAREARRVIEELTGLRRSLTQVRVFLHRAGLVLAEGRPGPGQGRPRQAGRVPARRAASAAGAGRAG
jgi:transposase